MPIYEYFCHACESTNEIEHNYNETIIKCPQCNKAKLERLISQTHGVVKQSDSEVTTVGQLAERNTNKIGKYKLSENKAIKKEDELSKGIDREYNQKLSKLGRMTKKQKERYIERGTM